MKMKADCTLARHSYDPGVMWQITSVAISQHHPVGEDQLTPWIRNNWADQPWPANSARATLPYSQQ
jgi:hypothetical protein